MATYYLHLHPQPFALIRSGKKTIESRLFDEKRKQYIVGDTLVFINRADESETIETRITHLCKDSSFCKLFLNASTKGKFSTDSLDELLNGIELYYSNEDQEKYGVVGIEFVVKRTR